MKIYRVVDKNGLFLRDDFTFTYDEIGLDVEPAQGFILPKWDGVKWVEGGTPLPPVTPPMSLEEKVDALVEVVAQITGVIV